MSLQVWVPLNGDLHNQGLSNISVSSSSMTYGNGKIGKGAIFTGSNFAISNTIIGSGCKEMSFACWIYPTTVDSTWRRIGGIGNHTRAHLDITSANLVRFFVSIDGTTGTYNSVTSTTVLSTNTWYHIVGTIDSQYIKIYINGQLERTANVTTLTSTAGDYLRIGSIESGNLFAGTMNDFRFYDHCLSPIEVKKLAQGLVLHYPLNRQCLGQENLWRNGSCQVDLTGMVQSSVPFTITNKDGYQCAHLSGQLATTSYLAIPDPMLPVAGEWYTITADMRIDNFVAGTTNPYVGLYFGGDYLTTDNTGGWYGGTSYSGDGKADNHTFVNTYNNQGWHRVSCTVQYVHGGSEYQKGPFRMGYVYARDFTGDLYVKNIKFERGKKATQYCPHQYDGLFNIAYYDRTLYTEPDGSQWIHAVHHNNPANALFNSTDDFVGGVYKDTNRWYQAENIFRTINKYEFMVKQKTTSNATEVKYRWTQNQNPLNATYTDVQPSAVTRITTSGYTDGTFGGIYVKGGQARLCIANATSGNWYGALGSWTAYNGGTPGYPNTTVTTGYMDLYVRIDNISINGLTEYDISGFGNNGTRIGNLSWSSDTPKYTVSTYFEDYTKYISGNMGDSWIPDAITMSCWIKGTNKSARGGYHLPLNMHSTNFEISITGSSGKARMGFLIGGTRYVSDIGSDILNGQWHMLTLTYNGSQICRYVDGVLVNSENRTGALTSASTLGIGQFPGQTTYGNTQLYESDVRIYATALSADDIADLYHGF